MTLPPLHRTKNGPLRLKRKGPLFFGKAVPKGFLVRTEQPITCLDSEPEPDLAVVRGEIAQFRRAHPRTAELLIEVCVTSADYDRSKLRAYARANVKECWLVLEPERQMEIHRQPSGDQFMERIVHGPGGHVVSAVFPGLTLDLSTIFG